MWKWFNKPSIVDEKISVDYRSIFVDKVAAAKHPPLEKTHRIVPYKDNKEVKFLVEYAKWECSNYPIFRASEDAWNIEPEFEIRWIRCGPTSVVYLKDYDGDRGWPSTVYHDFNTFEEAEKWLKFYLAELPETVYYPNDV